MSIRNRIQSFPGALLPPIAGVWMRLHVSETAPAGANLGDAWFDPATGIEARWNGNTWVVTSTTQGAPGSATNIVTSTVNPSSGSTITGVPDLDETHYVTKTTGGAIAALTWALPAAADARVGQMKVFYCNRNITALTVSGGTLVGSSLTAGVANEVYCYQCVSVSGSGTWLRIS